MFGEARDTLLAYVAWVTPFALWASIAQRQWRSTAIIASVLLLLIAYVAYRITRSIREDREHKRQRAIESAPIPPPEAIEILLVATLYAKPGTLFGVAAVVPPEARAFEGALQAGPRVLPDAHRLVAEGTPAGRVYGAYLVAAFDPANAAATWQRLRDDPGEVTVAPGGCTVMRQTVAEIANRQGIAGR